MESPMADPALHELDSFEARQAEDSTPALPETDRGTAVWLFLLGSFMIECLLWGFPFSFGVLQDYYSIHEPISKNPAGISAVGTTCSGILYLASPISFFVLQRWPILRRTSPYYGLPIIVLAIFLSSFATEVWHLLLTQGILYAIGGGFLYYPIFVYIDEWFVRRKGFAFGVTWAGSGCGGLAGPLVLGWGLERYGAKVFLRGWAVALLVLIGPLLYFVRPRLPVSRTHRVPIRTIAAGFGFLRTRAFWVIQLGNIVQGLGYFIPQLYLPTYARLTITNHNVNNSTGSLLLSLLNTASVPGVVLLSSLSDYLSVYTLILISTLGSTLSIFLLWGFASSSATLPLLICFSLTYGFFAGSFTATYAGTAKELRRVTPGGEMGRAETGSIFGLISLGRGIGNVICGPVSEALLKDVGHTGYAGGMFGPLIVFTGTTAAVAMGSWFVRRCGVV